MVLARLAGNCQDTLLFRLVEVLREGLRLPAPRHQDSEVRMVPQGLHTGCRDWNDPRARETRAEQTVPVLIPAFQSVDRFQHRPGSKG